jgi:hypothetical protein
VPITLYLFISESCWRQVVLALQEEVPPSFGQCIWKLNKHPSRQECLFIQLSRIGLIILYTKFLTGNATA